MEFQNRRPTSIRARLSARTSDTSSDAGFTLIELLVVLVIMPLIIGAITFALLGMFTLQSGVTNRITDTASAQVVSAVFVKDVQSADFITTQTGTPQCGAGTQLLGLKWASGQNSVSYSVVPVVSGTKTTYSLVRSQCTLNNTTPTMMTTITGDIDATQPAPTVTCNAGVAPCLAPTSWVPASNVSTVTASIYEPLSKYTFTLTATPRAWVAANDVNPGGSPYAAVTLLAANNTCPSTVLSVSNNATLSINVGSGTNNGVLAVNSICSGSVAVGNNGAINASSVVTTDPSLDSIAPNSKATYPASEVYSTLTDPFGGLVPPTPPSSAGSCSNPSGSNWTCTPGKYAASPSFPNNTVITFTAGNYDFASGLSIPNNATATFGKGEYTFANSSGSALTSSNNSTLTGNNVVFYVASGTVDFSNNSAISLTGLSTYNGVVIWDVGTGAVNLANNSSTVNSYGGVYAPQSGVNVSNNGTFATTFIVASTASLSNNATVQVTSP